MNFTSTNIELAGGGEIGVTIAYQIIDGEPVVERIAIGGVDVPALLHYLYDNPTIQKAMIA